MTADLSRLILQLASDNPVERAESAEKLAKLGPEARAAAVPLVRLAADPDERVREWAVSALEELGPPAIEDLTSLIASLNDAPPEVVYWSATLLGRLESEGAAATGPLAKVVANEGDVSARQRAAWALGEIGPAATAAVAALKEAAQSSDPRLARLATKALEKITG